MDVRIHETYDKIYRYCFYRLRCRAAAEDVTQEAFLRYFSCGEKGGTAYLFAIAKNLCTDFFRTAATESLPEDVPTEDFRNNTDTAIAVRSAMDMLDERHRETLILRYLSGLSVNETARVMGISRFAVNRAERSALAKMKLILGDDFNE